jgi:hypothetical protein
VTRSPPSPRSPRFRKSLSAHERACFLLALGGTGNFALACRNIGRSKSGLYKRRARDPEFAADCNAALARSSAWLWRTAPGPGSIPAPDPKPDPKSATILTRYAGRPQLRRAAPGTLTPAGRRRFFECLAATGNIRFAARQVGLAPSSIHHRRRTDPQFASEIEQALDAATAELELRVIEASGVFGDEHSPSRPGERQGVGAGRAIDRMTTAEALRVLEVFRRGRE